LELFGRELRHPLCVELEVAGVDQPLSDCNQMTLDFDSRPKLEELSGNPLAKVVNIEAHYFPVFSLSLQSLPAVRDLGVVVTDAPAGCISVIK
jgi:hypothetical protein